MIFNGLNSIEKLIGGILVCALFIILLYQTFGRNFGLTTTWTDEASRYLFVLLVYVGAGLAMLLGKHIKIDIMICIWPKPLRKHMEFLGVILGVLFCGYVCYQTLMYNINVVNVTGRLSPILGLKMSIPYTSVIIGYLLMCVRLIQAELIPLYKLLITKKDLTSDEGSEN